MAGKIVKECRETKDFGHIKFQKLQHLAEYLLEEDLAQNYYYQAAGPYDNQLMHNLANKLSQQGWYRKRTTNSFHWKRKCRLTPTFNGILEIKPAAYGTSLIYLATLPKHNAKSFPTLYAVWNDLLIAKTPFTDEDIIQRFYDWSDRKSRYTRNQLTKALAWMRENKIVPSGFGLIIKHKNEKP